MAGHVQIGNRDCPLGGGPGRESEVGGGDPFLDGPFPPLRNEHLLAPRRHLPDPAGGPVLGHRFVEEAGNPEPGVEALVHRGEPLVGYRVPAGEVHGGEGPDPESERPAGDIVHLLRGSEPFLHRKCGRQKEPFEDGVQGVAETARDRDRHLADLLVEAEEPGDEPPGGLGGDELHDRVPFGREEVVGDGGASRPG